MWTCTQVCLLNTNPVLDTVHLFQDVDDNCDGEQAENNVDDNCDDDEQSEDNVHSS